MRTRWMRRHVEGLTAIAAAIFPIAASDPLFTGAVVAVVLLWVIVIALAVVCLSNA